MDYEEIQNRFGYHKATPETIKAHQVIRALFIEAAQQIDLYVPDGREKALALTALQQAAMWSNAGIACNLAPLALGE